MCEDNKNNRSYTNGEITVYWRPALCTHSTICIHRLPRVFDAMRRPWVDLSQAETRKIIKTVEVCPSKALTYVYNSDL